MTQAMKVWVSGGGGFVGSNIVQAALDGGHEVVTTARTWQAPADAPYLVESVDMTDEAQVRSSIDGFEPDLVIHCAIMNDWHQMYADREAAWASYVHATRFTQGGANNADATYVLVSTDWVYDGTQPGAHEETPPNPINLYGSLKLASEMVALENGGAVARVSGVTVHGVGGPRNQHAGDPVTGVGVRRDNAVDRRAPRRRRVPLLRGRFGDSPGVGGLDVRCVRFGRVAVAVRPARS